MKKGQSTLEFTLTLIVLVILFAGMLQLFIWSSRSMVKRHNAYLVDFGVNYNNPVKFYTPERVDLVPGN